MLQVGIVRDDEHTEIIPGLCSLAGILWIEGRRVAGLYGPIVEVRSTDAAILLGESWDRRCGEARTWVVGRLLRHLSEEQDKVEKSREGVVLVGGSKTVVGVVEESVLSRTLGLNLREYLRVWTRTVREKGMLR